MRAFQSWNDPFESCAQFETFQGFLVAGIEIFGPAKVMEICVLWSDGGVVESG